MQAGEDDALTAEWIAEIVAWIKRTTPLAVTLSLGERSEDELSLWREAGADRYLLRFETSDPYLYRAIHPQRFQGRPDRLMLLKELKGLGYEAGGGVMVGIPGQSYASLAQDLLAFRDFDLDMIGIGPYIAHPATPLGSGLLCPPDRSWRAGSEQRTNGLQNGCAHAHSLSQRQIFPAPPRWPPSTARTDARKGCRRARTS